MMNKFISIPKKLEYDSLFGLDEDDELGAEVLEKRRRFVQFMGWRANHMDDRDRYDDKGSITVMQCSERKGSKNSEASMRITRVSSPDDILSIDMTKSNPEMHVQAQEYVDEHLTEKIEQGIVYDITRAVVNEENFNTKRSFKSMIRLLGYGQGITANDPYKGEDVWVMTLTKGLHSALNKVGIEPTVIAEGKISAHDEKDSVVCVVQPTEIYQREQHEMTRKFARKQYEDGLRAGIKDKGRRMALGQRALFEDIEKS